jgi:hypothetical protein
MIMKYSLVFTLSLLFSTSLLAAEPLPDFEASYRVEVNGIRAGELIQSLSSEAGDMRRFHTRTQARGVFALFRSDVIEESSLWSYHDGHIRPYVYRYSRTGGRKDKRLHLDFNWATNQVHIDDEEYPWDLKLQPGTLDKMVYQLQIMHDLQDLAEDEVVLEYVIAEGGKLKTYEVAIDGMETISTPLGDIEAIKMTRQRDADSGRQTTLWCAPSLRYLPIKLEHIEKDNSRLTAVINQLEGFPLDVFAKVGN